MRFDLSEPGCESLPSRAFRDQNAGGPHHGIDDITRPQRELLDAAIDTGLYQFTLTNRNGSRSVVNARYTFVYERRGGRWLIVNHHSSAVPTGG